MIEDLSLNGNFDTSKHCYIFSVQPCERREGQNLYEVYVIFTEVLDRMTGLCASAKSCEKTGRRDQSMYVVISP